MLDSDFSDLYERYSGDVHRFALWLSGNAALAEDIMADTFARAWVARDGIRVGSVKAYLLMIARHLYLDAVRRRRTEPLEPEFDLPDHASDPETAAAARRELANVLAALRELPEIDRSALLMVAVGGLPYEAVAAALGLSVSATRVRVCRTRVKLNETRLQRRSAS